MENNLVINGKENIYLFEYLQDLSDPKRFVQVALKNKGFIQKEVYNFEGVGFVDHFVKTMP